MIEIEKVFYSATDIVEMLDVSRATAYKLIRQMNNELQASGYIILQGKVPKAYFNQKWYGLNKTQLTEGA
ncbi:MAG: hypothetical protein IJN54_00930 [Lachnospiraceae bacterium]|nr:hypothetical protein [Lachnospiraceae bacterium]